MAGLVLQNIARQVFVAAEFAQPGVNIGGVHPHSLPGQACGLETDLVEQALHHGGQAPGADVFGAFVHVERGLGQPRDAGLGEVDAHRFGRQQRLVLVLSLEVQPELFLKKQESKTYLQKFSVRRMQST